MLFLEIYSIFIVYYISCKKHANLQDSKNTNYLPIIVDGTFTSTTDDCIVYLQKCASLFIFDTREGMV